MIYDLMAFFRRLFCKHRETYFVRNLYGDEIAQWSYNRSLWRCRRCGSLTAKPDLNSDSDQK